MLAIDENTITDAALEQMGATPDPRLKQIMAALVCHLHAFAREVDLTAEEWLEGIKFLTAVGQACTPYRQEFILLSDTLGLSSLVNTLHDRRSAEAGTKSSLLGPFYRQDSPLRRPGEVNRGRGRRPGDLHLRMCLRLVWEGDSQRIGTDLAVGRSRRIRSAEA